MTDRTISPQGRPEEVVVDAALRPHTLERDAGAGSPAREPEHPDPGGPARGEPLDHVLFYGPPGLGKTSLAWVLSHEMGVGMKVSAGPAIERAGDLAAILTNLRQGDILFIDEVHRLGRAVEEVLYPAMEDFALDIVVGKGPSARNIRLKLPRFTLVGATTRLALMTAPLRARFGAVYRFDFYDLAAMEAIVARAARLLQVSATPEGIHEIARRGRGTPRVGLRLLRRARDFAQVRSEGMITADSAREALALMDIDDLGLDALDRGRAGPHHPRLPGRAGGAGDHRRGPERGIRHDHGRGRAVPPPARLPRAHPARPRRPRAGPTSTSASPTPSRRSSPGCSTSNGA